MKKVAQSHRVDDSMQSESVKPNIYIYIYYETTPLHRGRQVSVARLTTVIKMYMYYDKSTCNTNMIRHLPYIHTRYKLSINSA